jgi:hypothetical protein
MPPIEIEIGNAVITIDMNFNEINEYINKYNLYVCEAGKKLKNKPYMSEEYIHELNWLNTNKYCKEFWKLKKKMYSFILYDKFDKLPLFKTKFATILSNSLELYENALELGDIDEGHYLYAVNRVKKAYDEVNFLIDTLEVKQ